jgi:uncharacterized coiled-coil DUF342 family protein
MENVKKSVEHGRHRRADRRAAERMSSELQRCQRELMAAKGELQALHRREAERMSSELQRCQRELMAAKGELQALKTKYDNLHRWAIHAFTCYHLKCSLISWYR